MTVEIKHSLHFVTVVDETHPVGMQLLKVPELMRTQMLEEMLKELLAPYLQPEIDRINERGTYAILKVAE
jgi:hypothetical protein